MNYFSFFGVLWTQNFEPLAVGLLLGVVVVAEHGVAFNACFVDGTERCLSFKLEKENSRNHIRNCERTKSINNIIIVQTICVCVVTHHVKKVQGKKISAPTNIGR